MNNYSHFKLCDEITYPFANFNGAILSHTLQDMLGLKLNPVIERGTWSSNELQLHDFMPT